MRLPEKVCQYLDRKRVLLKSDYRDSCSVIAFDVAKILMEANLKPEILALYGALLPDGVNTQTLVPKKYNGRRTWGAHVVCSLDDYIIDPLLPEPMKMPDYATAVFGQVVQVRKQVGLSLEGWMVDDA